MFSGRLVLAKTSKLEELIIVEVFALLELPPWIGQSVNELANRTHPGGSCRVGGDAGMLTYLILEREREIHVVSLLWAG
jgi:hypothetical protein